MPYSCGAREVVVRLGEDEGRDPASRPEPGVGDRGDDEDLADAAVRDEALGAVEEVVVALPHRGRARTAGVAPGSLFGESESAHHLPGGEEGDVALLLFRRCRNRRSGEVPSVVCADTVSPCDASTLASSWITIM